MKLVPDRIEAFLEFDGVISDHDSIRVKVTEVVQFCQNDLQKAKAIFEWVRDNIPHTKDIDGEVVTCTSIDVLDKGTGICFAKSHLVASMMRMINIPCGFCYQLFKNDLDMNSDSLALHGLNAVFLESTGKWHRVDPRGNRNDVRAEFSTDGEILAFPELKFLNDCIYAQPLEKVVRGLQDAPSISSLWPNLPSIPIT